MNQQKYAFLDRDGTIIWEPKRPDGTDPRNTFPLPSADAVKFMDGALVGMKQLVSKEYKLVMVTNQTFLGTKQHPQETFDQVMNKIAKEMKNNDLKFEFIMVCPHGPDEGCACRKPNIGGVMRFLEEQNNIDLNHSLMFGDRASDEEFAKNLGVRFIPIATNREFVLPNDL